MSKPVNNGILFYAAYCPACGSPLATKQTKCRCGENIDQWDEFTAEQRALHLKKLESMHEDKH